MTMTGPGKRRCGLLLALLLSGCASEPPENAPLGRLGLEPESPAVNIDDYSAPQNAGPFTLQGDLRIPDRDQVVFRYALPGAPDRRLDISLYPLPPGWHDLSAERIVSGHYGQVRQSLADRATRQGDVVLRAMQERLRRNVAGGYTVAEGVLLEESGARGRLIVVEIAALPKVFVRLTASAPEANGQEQLEDARVVLERFLEHQTQQRPSGQQPAEQEG